MKAKVSLKLKNFSIPAKIEKSRHIVTVMTGNANFATPVPALLAITTAATNLETAYNNAQGAGPSQTAVMHQKEVILNDLLTALANYVESTALGNEAIILSAGMDVKHKGGRKSLTFFAKAGSTTGDIELHTKAEKRASYIWEISPDPLPADTGGGASVGTWKQAGISTKASFMVTGLTERIKYWFRVAVVTKTGQAPWSDPIAFVVG